MVKGESGWAVRPESKIGEQKGKHTGAASAKGRLRLYAERRLRPLGIILLAEFDGIVYIPKTDSMEREREIPVKMDLLWLRGLGLGSKRYRR